MPRTQSAEEIVLMSNLTDLAIYVDLDGVLADYDAGIRRLGFDIDPSVKNDLNRSGTDNPLKRQMYEAIKGTSFYAGLPLMPDALKLWSGIRRADPIITTAAPKFGATEENYYLNPYWLGAAYHKRRWMEEGFLPSVYATPRAPLADERFICTTSARKSEFMHRKKSPHQILIDDRIANCVAWVEAGGYAHLYDGNADKALRFIHNLALKTEELV